MHDEAAAFAHVEAMLWPDGPVCPHCGVVDRAYRLEGVRTKATKKNPEGKVRHGLWKCRECRKQFTVRKGTIFEESHLPLHLWLQAIHLMVSSKKGISSHQLHRVLGITYKSAWFLTHRIRECMRDGALAPMGGNGGTVEVDETFIGKEPSVTKAKNARGYAHKMKVLTLVDRDTKHARSVVVDDLKRDTLVPILRENIAAEAVIYTDEAGQYTTLGNDFAGHDFTRHGSGEYVRLEAPEVHTNTVEGFYSIFKRGMKGVYQHCGKQHLHRYAAEFDFRYNHRIANGVDDAERGHLALRGATGKRLTYARPD
jgi:transposase-like protein